MMKLWLKAIHSQNFKLVFNFLGHYILTQWSPLTNALQRHRCPGSIWISLSSSYLLHFHKQHQLSEIHTVLSTSDLVQFSSVAQSLPTLCDPMNCNTPGLPIHHQLLSLPRLMPIESVMPSNHLILCRPVLHLPSIFFSIRVFSNESALCIRWPKY